ncbi:hypothetical protein MVES1_003901 [Malassezia vespertilionis]|nr:uncharacterized protein MVES1_003901 [Malassezia vespertilionis]WFD08525.1 hypothetical protein MVES1_003901 [Malassezia vespertilionis]
MVTKPATLAKFEEWYGVWRPFTPRPFTQEGTGKRGDRTRRADDFGARMESRRSQRGGAAAGAAVRASHKELERPAFGRMRSQEDAPLGWRRVGAQPEGDASLRTSVPAWMAEEGSAPPPPTAGRVDSIQQFKAQMREKERRERGEPSDEQQRSMYEDLSNIHEDDAVNERSSRFARFFDVRSEGSKGSAPAQSETQAPQAGSFDLFNILQNAGSQSGPSLERELPAPQDQQAPSAAPLMGGPSGPSAKDMASMQVLMAKLMGQRAPASPGAAHTASPQLGTPQRVTARQARPAEAQPETSAPGMAFFNQLLSQAARSHDKTKQAQAPVAHPVRPPIPPVLPPDAGNGPAPGMWIPPPNMGFPPGAQMPPPPGLLGTQPNWPGGGPRPPGMSMPRPPPGIPAGMGAHYGAVLHGPPGLPQGGPGRPMPWLMGHMERGARQE